MDKEIILEANEEKRIINKRIRDNYYVQDEYIRTNFGDLANGHAILMKDRYYNNQDEFIGNKKDAQYLFKKGIEPIKSNSEHCVCSIGFCKKENKWYGWSHRTIIGFGIGDMIFEECFGNDYTLFTKHGSKTITNMEEAKQSAINFADYIS